VTARIGIRAALALGVLFSVLSGVIFGSSAPAVAGDEAAVPDLSQVKFKPPDARLWTLGTHEGDQKAFLLQFITGDETMDNWTSMVTLQEYTLEGVEFPAVDEAVKLLEKRMRKRCPKVNWEVLAETPWSITYHWRTFECENQPNESELARFMVSPDRAVRIAYTIRPGPLLPAERERLEAWLAGFASEGP
jgi:hypothetical protein